LKQQEDLELLQLKKS